ncbi:MAG: hypothetical protein AB1422_06720 [bacterium]
MKKVTHTVVCPYNKDHKFPVVLELKDESKGTKSSIDTFCPFCDKIVRVEIEGELSPDTVIMRGKEEYL